MRKIYLMIASMLVLCINLSHAQELSISGKVTEASTGEPIAGANVIVQGTTRGTITNIDGSYTLTVPDGSVVVFSFIGYVIQEIPISGGQTTYDVQLADDVTSLNEVIISGLASSIKRSNLANSVDLVKADELTGIVDQSTMDGALYGKFKGANITANSGAPGGGISIKLRGITSLNGTNEPLYIIDGVYIDNSTISAGLNVVSAAAGGGSQSNQDNPSNRIADIDPMDIETIEILKGASAAAMYGSRASGGVVVITTKKGKQGAPKINLSQSVGVTTMLRPLGVREWDETKAETHFGVAGRDAFIAARNAGTLNNHEEELYGNKGLLSTSRITISGGNPNTRYFIGATRKDDEGIIKNTGYTKYSFRANVDQKLADWLELGVNTNFIHSSADRAFFNNDNSGTTMGIAFVATPAWAQLQPDADGNYPNNPYAASNFIETRDKVTNNETIDRFIGGANVKLTLFQKDNQSLKFSGRAGIDYYTLATTALFPNTVQFQSNGNGLNGVSVQGTTQSRNTNFNGFLIHDIFVGNGLSFKTQFGFTNENFNRNTILGTASNMNGDQTNLDQGGSVAVDQTRIIQHDKGFFAQEEVNFSDKIIATLGIRGDKSSNNGDANKLFYYPKGSIAINLHEFGIGAGSVLSQLKVRAAYGEAGNFANFGDKYTSLSAVVIDGNSGTSTLNKRGNPDIGPERQKEFETGFDLGLFEGKLLFDFTYYIKNVEDLLLTAQVPSSSGFTSQVLNAAELQNKGIELGLTWNVMATGDFNWNLTSNWWTNDSEVTRLDIPSYTTGGFADFLGQFRIKQGHSPTEIIGVGPDPDEDGLMVFGNAEAKFNMSLINNLSYKNFDLSFLFHWKNGGENINLTALLSDLSGTSADYDKVDLDPEGVLGNGDYRLGELGSNSEPYIEDAGYIRMREIGLYYNIPKSVFSDVMSLRLGFSGNNLINIFEYRSYDPEVSNFGGKGLSTGVEVTPFPSSKRFNFHVIANF
jgi:TonB-linked SusC/RagA family outer membrane protein